VHYTQFSIAFIVVIDELFKKKGKMERRKEGKMERRKEGKMERRKEEKMERVTKGC
jgi:hypothetical protein